MAEKSYIDVVYEVWDNESGTYLTVGPDADAGGYPEIRARGEKNVQYYGDIRLPLRPDLARKLGEALIKCADDCDAEESLHS